jgi:hypothetical protein
VRRSLSGILLLLAGCAATPGYEGPRRAGSEVAVVSATRDPERTTRHEVLLEAEAGGRYRLAAVIGSPQEGCSGVAIE